MATTDGTQLNPGTAGDLVSDEDMTGQSRLSPLVPQLGTVNAGYKIERTKIAIGAYGSDAGDVTPDAPLAVRTSAERWSLEWLRMNTSDSHSVALIKRSSERVSSVFGRSFSDRGQR
jgi:hypothetical protein